jgi:Trk K+ transport system NAD-binding subunit
MGLTVLALKPREGAGSVPRGETVLREGDVIVVGGSRENLDASELLRPGGR